jgi:hypothetical protein
MSKPELWHYKAAQHLILYLRSTRTLGLLYSQRNMRDQHVRVTAATEVYDPFLEGAVDASFADDPETNRSTSGLFVVWFGGSPVDWECKRQPLVTMSTMESEYVAASKCVLSIRFLHKFMVFMDMSRKGPTKVHEEDNNHPKPPAKSAEVQQVRYITNPNHHSWPKLVVPIENTTFAAAILGVGQHPEDEQQGWIED